MGSAEAATKAAAGLTWPASCYPGRLRSHGKSGPGPALSTRRGAHGEISHTGTRPGARRGRGEAYSGLFWGCLGC
jgi:hypothetical protein